MRTMQRCSSRVILLALTAVIVSSVSAAPFQVHRASNGSSLVAAPQIVATTSFAPFDDQAGLLHDGQSYFYLVSDLGGSPVQLSVHKNLVLDTVRLGFDDGNPTSAGVDPAMSTVVAQPAVIPADAVSAATLIIVPRDSAGTPLGAGLDVQVDVGALLPGFPSGAVIDGGNGEYRLFVVSWTPGTGTAVVTVEGQTLNDQPVLTYEPADPLGPLGELEQIRADFQAIIDAAPGASYAAELGTAIEHIDAALAELQLVPVNRKRVNEDIRRAIQHTLSAVGHGFDPVMGAAYCNRMAGIARAFAVQAIDATTVAGGDPSSIATAQLRLSEGDALRSAGDYQNAAQKYMQAAQNAEAGMP